jgi:hypothetical protein
MGALSHTLLVVPLQGLPTRLPRPVLLQLVLGLGQPGGDHVLQCVCV